MPLLGGIGAIPCHFINSLKDSIQMEDHKDYSATIKSCAIAFLCVCENLMEEEQIQSWAKGDTNPNDYMDANVILDQIMVNYGIDTFNEDGEISDEIADLFNAIFNQANELVAKKHKNKYLLEGLQESINDIVSQLEQKRINRDEARVLARRCCFEFVKDM
jgi:hypothetical protein